MTMFPIDIDFSRIKEVLTYDPQAPMIFSSGIFLWLFTASLVVYVLLQHNHTALSRFAISFWRSSWRVPKAIGSVKGW